MPRAPAAPCSAAPAAAAFAPGQRSQRHHPQRPSSCLQRRGVRSMRHGVGRMPGGHLPLGAARCRCGGALGRVILAPRRALSIRALSLQCRADSLHCADEQLAAQRRVGLEERRDRCRHTCRPLATTGRAAGEEGGGELFAVCQAQAAKAKEHII
eukprot:360853-Chlamydomonas_euryale.AAC.3